LNAALLSIAFGLAAAFYSAAGFGGGTAYLAILALAAVPTRQAGVIALLCNVIVVARTSWAAARSRQLDWLGLAAFGVLSVPAALLGAAYPLKDRHLDLLLALTLLSSAVAMASPKRTVESNGVRHWTLAQRWQLGGLVGVPLGLVSGMVGIGGGVFLSPLLHYFRWDASRRIATLCSAFILVNSLAGLAGKRATGALVFDLQAWWVLPIAVWVGGRFGTRLLLTRLSNQWITRATAAVVFLGSLQAFWRAWPK
jgi:uncharacterized protein